MSLSETDGPSEALAMLDAALSSMPYGFSIWDENHRLVRWNQGFVDMYGYPPERLSRGMSLADFCELTISIGLFAGTKASNLAALFGRRLAASRDPAAPGIFENVIDGRMIETTYLPSAGLGWVVIHEETSEQKRREAELRDKNLLLDAAFDSMPYGFSLWDANLRLVLCNRRLGEIYGLDEGVTEPGLGLVDLFRAGLIGTNDSDERAVAMAEGYAGRLAALSADETLVTEETFAGGRVLRISHRRMPGGGWVASHADITVERARLRELQARGAELEAHNIRFEIAVNNMTHGLCMFDRASRLIICNEPYRELYGLPPHLVVPGTPIEEILQDRIARGVHPKEGAEDYLQRGLSMVRGRKEAADIVELQDGRVIQVGYQPMADGGWVSTHQDITEQRHNEARFHHLARHDALTELPNRTLFVECMEDAEERIKRREIIAVLIVDVDYFKSVNDLFGHSVGDKVLREVALRLLASCRDGDVVAQLGGDEFAILCGPLNTTMDAAILADRIVSAMSEPVVVDGRHIRIGASVGIAAAPTDGKDAETLMKNADLALYRAKREGRGTYHFFEAAMDAALQERLALEVELRAAFAAGELALVFQPLFSLKENRICGFEALIRWHHPVRGTIMPGAIIPIAEESGLIVPIGAWVLTEACQAAVGWPEHVRVAVNLSGVQFKHRDLVQHVAAALSASGLSPGRLEIEVTESVLLSDNDLTLKTFQHLRELGVRISVDDFGTGYSSLSYLRTFAFDRIKIDQSFIQDISQREDSLAVIRAVIGLGRSLGLATTAEGVETESQLTLVREQGCTEVQGFLFSPPLSGSAVNRLFAETAPDDASSDRRIAS